MDGLKSLFYRQRDRVRYHETIDRRATEILLVRVWIFFAALDLGGRNVERPDKWQINRDCVRAVTKNRSSQAIAVAKLEQHFLRRSADQRTGEQQSAQPAEPPSHSAKIWEMKHSWRDLILKAPADRWRQSGGRHR